MARNTAEWDTSSYMGVAALFTLDTADILFLGGAFVVAAVFTLLANPLTSWVNKMAGGDRPRTPGKKP
jgi:hypothetical protein